MPEANRVSIEEFRRLLAKEERKGGKYGARKTEVDGIRFDSAREAARYAELRLLERAGRIRDLRLQVPYRLEVEGQLVATYVADFVYDREQNGAWAPVVEDAKGYRTREYRMKRRLMRAVHGIEVEEV